MNIFKMFRKCRHENTTLFREVPNIGFPDALTRVFKCNNCHKVQTEVWNNGEFFAVFSPY